MSRFILPSAFLATLMFLGIACTSVTTPCNVHKTTVTISASATCVKVGEVVTVTVTLTDQGCIPLRNVAYGLSQSTEGESSLLVPIEEKERALSQTPLPLFIEPGASGIYQSIYRASKPGWVTLTGDAQYLVVLDTDDWYMETVESAPLTIWVTPP